MKILLFTDFTCSLPEQFITFLQTSYPSLCSETVNNLPDFNRWDVNIRTDRQSFSAIKLYEKNYGTLSHYFKYYQSTNKTHGFITVDSDTHEEFWDESKKK